MKKLLTTIITIALLASLSSLTGCVYTEKTSDSGNSQNSEKSKTGSDNSSQNSETSSENSEPESYDFKLRSTDEGFAEKLALFNLPDLELPNGVVIKNSDADFVHGYKNGDMVDYIGFDSVYMYKSKPYYRSTIDEPDMINWETLEIKDDPGEFTDYEYFKVKAGDTLDNGLTVKSAEFWYGRIMYDHYVDISFDGELTLEGVIYRTPEDEYGTNKGDLHFFPDASKTGFYSPFRPYNVNPILFADNVNKFAVSYSSENIRLGNETEAPLNIAEILGDGVFAKVKVTVTDLRFQSTNFGTIPTAVIKNISAF